MRAYRIELLVDNHTGKKCKNFKIALENLLSLEEVKYSEHSQIDPRELLEKWNEEVKESEVE